MDEAKAIRNKLCLVAECEFDRGCGCLEAITEALAVKDAEIERLRAAHTTIVERAKNDPEARAYELADISERAFSREEG